MWPGQLKSCRCVTAVLMRQEGEMDKLADLISNLIESDGEYTPRGSYLLARKIADELHSKGFRQVEAVKIPENSYPLKEDYENNLMAIGFERALVRLKSTNPNGLFTEVK
jgi:hypothetical protein